jgi:hypothetical protein
MRLRLVLVSTAASVVLVGGAASAQTPVTSQPATAPAAAAPAPTAPAAAAPAAPESTPAPADAPPAPPPAAPAPVPTSPAPAAPVVAPAPPAATPPISFAALGKRYTSWDANLEGGVGRVLTPPGETVGLFRARAGVLWVRDPNFFSLGVTYELSHMSAATLGVQAEYLSLETGFFAQIGPLVDVADKGKVGFMTSIGVSLFGIEYQGRDYNGGYASAVFGKLRIPLGIIGFGIRGR